MCIEVQIFLEGKPSCINVSEYLCTFMFLPQLNLPHVVVVGVEMTLQLLGFLFLQQLW